MTVARAGAAVLACALFAPAAGAQPPLADPPWLRQELEQFRARHGIVALGAAIAIDDRVVAASVVGTRRFGAPDPARQDDRFHLGSVAKPVTATVIARYVDQGFLHWSDTVRRMFPGYLKQARPEYLDVTLTQLITHTSGMPYQPRTPEAVTDREGPTARDRRRGYVIAALRDPPEAPPGTKSIYGGGHIIAAHYLEETMGEPFEALAREQVFGPLGMTRARFGPPASPGTLDGPWEHVMENGRPKPVPPSRDQFVQARSPAGRNLVMSMGDLGRFVAMHLAGARGKSRFLKPETFAFLDSVLPPLNVGVGWATGRVSWARGRVLWHSGSTGRNFCLCHILPDEGFAICVAANIYFPGIHERMDALTAQLAKDVQAGRFARR
jgi:CubicO group peptidase (beta-lactamase class C family)